MISENSAAEAAWPTPLRALWVWATAGMALLTASAAVGSLAALRASRTGVATEELLLHPGWLAAGTIANELAVAFVLWLWLRKLGIPLSAAVSPDRPSGAAVGAAALLIFGLAPFGDVAGELTRRALDVDMTATLIVLRAVERANPPLLALLFLALAVAPALVEEAFFRGFLTPVFARHSTLAGVVVPSVLFGIFHIEPTQVAGTIVLGIGFGLVRIFSGSLGACMLVHGSYNAALLLALSFDPTLPEHDIELLPPLIGLAMTLAGVALLARISSRARARNRSAPRA